MAPEAGPSELILIGVLHNDLNGARRLQQAFHYFQPDLVTVEYSEHDRPDIDGILNLMSSSEGISRLVEHFLENVYRNANPDTLAAWLSASYFEYVASRDYCQQKGIPLRMIDPSSVTAQEPSTVTQLQRDPNSGWNRGAHRSLQSTVDQLIELTEQGYEYRVPTSLERGEERIHDMTNRDAVLEQSLRGLKGRVLHSGGLFHFTMDYRQYGGERNLLERLADLNPVFLTLKEVDTLPRKKAGFNSPTP